MLLVILKANKLLERCKKIIAKKKSKRVRVEKNYKDKKR